MDQHKIEYLDPSSLRPRDRNPRTHSPKQIRQIADSILRFGFTNPVLIDVEGRIIAGHGRVESAKLLGLDRVPAIKLEHLSEAQKRAYVIADNKLAENAGWDSDILRIEFQYLSEFDIDLTITGFETAEIDLIMGEPEVEAAEEVPPPEPDRKAPAVTRRGDLWLLSHHRLFCGNALEVESYLRLMDGAEAQMVFIDPPYNVKIDGNVCGSGRIKHPEFAMAVGEMSEAEFTAFLETVFTHLAAYSAEGAIQFICMDWRHMTEVLAAGKKAYTEFKNLCVWNKTNGGMGSFYRSKHELVFVYKASRGQHINNIELGRHGRYRTNAWDYPGISSLGNERAELLAIHPTVKPVALVADAIMDCSKRGGIVLDAFAGSGTTLLAAEKTGRRGYAMELDPYYVDVTLKRLGDAFGLEAIHDDTGVSFDEIRKCRAQEIVAVEEAPDGR